jgi:hypothetical protein
VKMKIRTALLLVVIPSAFVATSCAPSAMSDSRAADASAIQALDEQWSPRPREMISKGLSRSMPMTQYCFLPTRRSPQIGSR